MIASYKMFLKDIVAMRLLILFSAIVLVFGIVGCVLVDSFTIIGLGCGILLLVLGAFYLLLCIFPVATIAFDARGIRIITKKDTLEVLWENVKKVQYCSFNSFLLLKHFTMDLIILQGGKLKNISNEFGSLKLSVKEYQAIISLIPKELLNKDPWMVYNNILEVEEDRYNVLRSYNSF